MRSFALCEQQASPSPFVIRSLEVRTRTSVLEHLMATEDFRPVGRRDGPANGSEAGCGFFRVVYVIQSRLRPPSYDFNGARNAKLMTRALSTLAIAWP